jgi:hypothetical protein
MEPEYITLNEAATLAGVAPAELRRYANEHLPDGTQRLKTKKVGTGQHAVHLTTAEWVRTCMANRKRVRRNRPVAPILQQADE